MTGRKVHLLPETLRVTTGGVTERWLVAPGLVLAGLVAVAVGLG